MNPPLLSSHSPLEAETIDEFSQRYEGYGKGLYAYLERNDRALYDQLQLFRAKAGNHQPADSYAILTVADTEIAIQLDPECAMIIVWDEDVQVEFGEWEELRLSKVHKTLLRMIH